MLKDAGAYSIYGVRGANGAIVITTKKGKGGKAKISYDFYIGRQQPLKGLDLLNPQEQADLEWLRYKNSGQVPTMLFMVMDQRLYYLIIFLRVLIMLTAF